MGTDTAANYRLVTEIAAKCRKLAEEGPRERQQRRAQVTTLSVCEEIVGRQRVRQARGAKGSSRGTESCRVSERQEL